MNGLIRVCASELTDQVRDKKGNGGSSYDGKTVHADQPGVALPATVYENLLPEGGGGAGGARPNIVITYTDKNNKKHTACAPLVDKGPWNTTDPYWNTPGGRPRAESAKTGGKGDNHKVIERICSQSGSDTKLPAGIDLTTALMNQLGMTDPGAASPNRSGMVDWEFLKGACPK